MKNIFKITALALALSASVVAPVNASEGVTGKAVEKAKTEKGDAVEKDKTEKGKKEKTDKNKPVEKEPIKYTDEQIKDIMSKFVDVEKIDEEVLKEKIKDIKNILEYDGLITEARKDGIKGLLNAKTKEELMKALAQFNPQGPIEEYPLTENSYKLTETDNGFTFEVKGNQFETDKEGILALDRNYTDKIPQKDLIDAERNALIGKYIVNKNKIDPVSQAAVENVIHNKDVKLEEVIDTHLILNEKLNITKDSDVLKETKEKFVKENNDIKENEDDKEKDTKDEERKEEEKTDEEIEKYREDKITEINVLMIPKESKDKYIQEIKTADTKEKIDEVYNTSIKEASIIKKLKEDKIAEINKLNLSDKDKELYITQIKNAVSESDMNKAVDSAKQDVLRKEKEEEKKNKIEGVKQNNKLQDLKDEKIKQIESLNNLSEKEKKEYTDRIKNAETEDDVDKIYDNAERTNNVNYKMEVKDTVAEGDVETGVTGISSVASILAAAAMAYTANKKKKN